MTSSGFRQVALSMPGAVESSHMGHPDFRVGGKIFATLFSKDGVDWGMVKLKPAQQRELLKAKREVFQPIKGGWGRQGCTQVCLKSAGKKVLRDAMFTAWCNTAPKKFVEEFGSKSPSR